MPVPVPVPTSPSPSLAHALHALFPDAAAPPLRELHVVALCLSPGPPLRLLRLARMYFENCTGAGSRMRPSY